MAVTSATGSQAAGQDIGALGKAQLASSYDTFMKLLTTQIQNQDPLSPLDSNQFTQQLVQMTGVQQQLYSNDLLKQLVGNRPYGPEAAGRRRVHPPHHTDGRLRRHHQLSGFPARRRHRRRAGERKTRPLPWRRKGPLDRRHLRSAARLGRHFIP